MSRRVGKTMGDVPGNSHAECRYSYDSFFSGFARLGSRVDRTVVQEDYQTSGMSLKEERMSIMLSVLPTSIQNRLPRVPSVRRSLAYSMRSVTPSPHSSGTTTPVSDNDGFMELARRDEPMMEPYDYTPPKAPIEDPIALQTSASQVNWRSGRQGLDLVMNAAAENRARSYAHYSDAFERKAYIDGVAYLLDGLPRDMDAGEMAVIGRSLPPSLSTRSNPGEDRQDSRTEPSAHDNWIHNLLLFILMRLMLWARWALPYGLLLISTLMRYEREHKISENMLGTTMACMAFGLEMLKRMGNGPLGQLLTDTIEYMAQGVSGALREFAQEEIPQSGTRRR